MYNKNKNRNVLKTLSIIIPLFVFFIFSSFFVSATDITTCQTLSSGTYNLQNNVSSTDTCMIITGNNVVLDCQGNWITYSTSARGDGVRQNSGGSVTIKNCNIYEQTSISSAYGIYLRASTGHTMFGNTIQTKGSSAHGIYAPSRDALNITNNTIITSGSGTGIYLTNNEYSHLKDNILTIGLTGYGIYLTNSQYLTTSNNNVTIIGYPAWYIYGTTATYWNGHSLPASNYVNGLPLNYTTNKDNSYWNGMNFSQYGQTIFSNSDNITINNSWGGDALTLALIQDSRFNNVSITATSQRGLIIMSNTDDNNFSNIDISTTNYAGYGIFHYTGANDGNRFTNFTIETLGSSAHGIYFYDGDYSLFDNVTISTSGSSSYGLYLYYGDNDLYKNLSILTEGSSAYGIFVLASATNPTNNHSFYDLNLTTTGSSARGIFDYRYKFNADFYNSTITTGNANAHDIYFNQNTCSGTHNYYNVTFDSTFPYIKFLSGQTSVVNTYYSFYAYVDDIGSNPLEFVNVILRDKESNMVYEDTTDANGLTESGNLLTYSFTESYTNERNNHTLQVYKAGYDFHSEELNITTNVLNYSVQLSPAPQVPPFITFTPPTPNAGVYLSRNWITANMSVIDWALGWNNFTAINDFSGDVGGHEVALAIDNNTATSWHDANTGIHYTYAKLNNSDNAKVDEFRFYVNASATNEACGVTIEIGGSPIYEGVFNESANGLQWYTAPLPAQQEDKDVNISFWINNSTSCVAPNGGVCSGTLDCSNFANDFNACNDCTQCDINGYVCGGDPNLDCSVFNGDQPSCDEIDDTICQWDVLFSTCLDIGSCNDADGTLELLQDCEFIEGMGAGCSITGQCDDFGSCESCGDEDQCSNQCGTANCNWGGETLENMYEMQWAALTEVGEISSCWLNWSNWSNGTPPPTIKQETMTKIGTGHKTYCILNLTDIPSTTIWLQFVGIANDSEDQWGSSEIRIVYFDLLSPIITYKLPTPANDSYVGATYTYINISSNEALANQSLLWRTPIGSSFVWDIYNMTFTHYDGIKYFYGYNKTGLIDQTYMFWVYVEDAAGNNATLENRTITIETEGPTLLFIPPTPADDNLLMSNNFIVNVSSSKSLNFSYLEFGGTNISINHTTGYASHNITGITYGRYKYKVYGNSTITGIWGETEYRIIRINPEGIFGQTFLLLAILLIPMALVLFGWKTGNWVFTMLASFIFLIWGVYFYLYPLVDINNLINLAVTLVSFGTGAYLLGATAIEIVGRMD